MPQIETPRLKLRRFTHSDFDTHYRYIASDAQVMQTLLLEKALSINEARLWFERLVKHWDNHQFGVWLLFDKQTTSFVGQCGLRFLANTPQLELTYALARHYWGQGIATEAAKASLKYGFEQLDAEQIFALSAPNNAISQRVMQKIGMKYQGYHCFYHTEAVYYAISKQEWQPDDSRYILH